MFMPKITKTSSMVISRLHSVLTLGVAELTLDEWKCDRYLIIIAVLAWQILACFGKIMIYKNLSCNCFSRTEIYFK